MIRYPKWPLSRNRQPDLFDWLRERELRQTNPAVQLIAQRFGLPPQHALTIANLAGIGPEVTR